MPPRSTAAREFNQHIQVWRVGVTSEGERFCALVQYQGSFTAGPSSPKGTPITPGIDGSFEGGYLLLFNAEETAPRYKTQGHIGTFTGTEEVPISLYDWRDFYFNTVAGSDVLQWWGWIYHGGNNGAWVNAIGGVNQGDITD